MKTYNAPSVASKESVTESTRAVIIGHEDPKNPMLLEKTALGSVGFQL
jgi:hypothetical protein